MLFKKSGWCNFTSVQIFFSNFSFYLDRVRMTNFSSCALLNTIYATKLMIFPLINIKFKIFKLIFSALHLPIFILNIQ